jgi:hypothetical protein
VATSVFITFSHLGLAGFGDSSVRLGMTKSGSEWHFTEDTDGLTSPVRLQTEDPDDEEVIDDEDGDGEEDDEDDDDDEEDSEEEGDGYSE